MDKAGDGMRRQSEQERDEQMKKQGLKAEIEETLTQWENANRYFNYAEGKEQVDYAIFSIITAEKDEMKMVWTTMLIGSSALLIWILIRNRMSLGWLKGFALHLIAAAAVLYVLNYSGWIADMYIPLNPITVGTVFVLGVPGIALLTGLQMTVM
jgi:inhibitor of the pro-sigma K processing machinery